MKTWVTGKCPYCGFNNKWKEKVPRYRNWKVHWCDNGEGGCDLPFVVEIEVENTVTTHPISGITKDRR